MINKTTQFDNAEKFVRTVLRDVPITRNNDRVLMLEVWERQGLHLTTEQKKMFMRVLNPETIRRTRQLTQASGLYRASERVQQERMFQAGNWSDHFAMKHENETDQEFEEWLNK